MTPSDRFCPACALPWSNEGASTGAALTPADVVMAARHALLAHGLVIVAIAGGVVATMGDLTGTRPGLLVDGLRAGLLLAGMAVGAPLQAHLPVLAAGAARAEVTVTAAPLLLTALIAGSAHLAGRATARRAPAGPVRRLMRSGCSGVAVASAAAASTLTANGRLPFRAPLSTLRAPAPWEAIPGLLPGARVNVDAGSVLLGTLLLVTVATWTGESVVTRRTLRPSRRNGAVGDLARHLHSARDFLVAGLGVGVVTGLFAWARVGRLPDWTGGRPVIAAFVPNLLATSGGVGLGGLVSFSVHADGAVSIHPVVRLLLGLVGRFDGVVGVGSPGVPAGTLLVAGATATLLMIGAGTRATLRHAPGIPVLARCWQPAVLVGLVWVAAAALTHVRSALKAQLVGADLAGVSLSGGLDPIVTSVLAGAWCLAGLVVGSWVARCLVAAAPGLLRGYAGRDLHDDWRRTLLDSTARVRCSSTACLPPSCR